MVNIGRPSKGCLNCRRSRVKCDEVHPTCARCTRMKADCEWQDTWSVMLRPQEKWAKKKVAQRVERVQTLRAQHETSRTAADALLKAVVLPTQPQIAPEFSGALNQFYADYFIGGCPFLHLIRPMLGSPQTPAAIQNVLPAIALANLAKKLHRQDLMARADMHYGKSLRRLAKSLSNPEVAKHDATILSAMLLSLYETICYDRYPGTVSPFISHATGRLALLKIRGREQLNTPTGRNVFFVLHHEQLVSSFISETAPSDEIHSWIYGKFPAEPMITMEMLTHDASRWLAQLKKALNRKPAANEEEVMALLESGLRLHDLAVDLTQLFRTGDLTHSVALPFYAEKLAAPYQPSSVTDKATTRQSSTATVYGEIDRSRVFGEKSDWVATHWVKSIEPLPRIPGQDGASIPSKEWAYSPEQPPTTNWGRDPQAPKTYHPNDSSATTAPLLLCRAAHIHLLQGLLKAVAYVRTLPPHPSIPTAQTLETLKHTFNDAIRDHAIAVHHELPLAVDDALSHEKPELSIHGNGFRAYILLWPLRAAIMAEQTPQKYKRAIAAQLREINRVHGIGMALDIMASVGLAEQTQALAVVESTRDSDTGEIVNVTSAKRWEHDPAFGYWADLEGRDLKKSDNEPHKVVNVGKTAGPTAGMKARYESWEKVLHQTQNFGWNRRLESDIIAEA